MIPDDPVHLLERPYWSMGQAKTSTLGGQCLARRREGAGAVGPIKAQRTTKASARMATPTSAATISSSVQQYRAEDSRVENA